MPQNNVKIFSILVILSELGINQRIMEQDILTDIGSSWKLVTIL